MGAAISPPLGETPNKIEQRTSSKIIEKTTRKTLTATEVSNFEVSNFEVSEFEVSECEVSVF